MNKKIMRDPEHIQFDAKLSFHYGYTCFDCPHLNTGDRNSSGEPWCSAWSRYISDPNYEGDRCSRRPAWPNR